MTPEATPHESMGNGYDINPNNSFELDYDIPIVPCYLFQHALSDVFPDVLAPVSYCTDVTDLQGYLARYRARVWPAPSPCIGSSAL